ncbi:hypothetical protein MARPO_2227s0001 [Marchantia polymorpha]|uniref:Uncharacterized protein n=1 Tax=Marchantia polymorpha TaxID=3197 RepID=A0A2R6VXP0_MARPO|nr:hypothetical protein MARPO_2227s0001 [Marchantia polymorpha]|eukprot:PTQ26379.1 hypothetical protein MARPO_2227s0001 [Marchantia polymorpha]
MASIGLLVRKIDALLGLGLVLVLLAETLFCVVRGVRIEYYSRNGKIAFSSSSSATTRTRTRWRRLKRSSGQRTRRRGRRNGRWRPGREGERG